MDACEVYSRRLTMNEDIEVDTLSEWIKYVVDVLRTLSTLDTSPFSVTVMLSDKFPVSLRILS